MSRNKSNTDRARSPGPAPASNPADFIAAEISQIDCALSATVQNLINVLDQVPASLHWLFAFIRVHSRFQSSRRDFKNRLNLHRNIPRQRSHPYRAPRPNSSLIAEHLRE